MNEAVQARVRACRVGFGCWALYGGGSPANKYFEIGRLNATETIHCRIHVNALADTIVKFYEELLAEALQI